MFRSLLIANRGEIALRVIRACKELGIRAVAIYSEADRNSPHLDEADETICVGGPRATESYLNMDAVLAAAEATECQALHPGYGFLAENAHFAARCLQQKISFVGPPPGAIRLMGDKARARQTMKQAGLSPIPGSDGVVTRLDEARGLAADMGYPLLLKATAGGGGKGMRIVRKEGELATAFAEARLEAEKAFGNPGLYLEKFIEAGRHIEFQILVDCFGSAIHLGERECSVQRSHQKLLEESPSPAVSAEVRDELGPRVARAAAAIGYTNAGTVEFLMDGEGHLYFMEMNTRLQVEHPVTEMVTGIDLVKEQIAIAANVPLRLKQEDIRIEGHAVEARLNAEDPANGFQPDPGTIAELKTPPLSEKLRLDSHVAAGYRIPPYYDSMIGKLIAGGVDRRAACDNLAQALKKFEIVGVKTTIPLHQEILRDEEFGRGNYNTQFLERILPLINRVASGENQGEKKRG